MSHLIDVRTEKEFSKGHIPGAHLIPLFCDNEHQKVGALYKSAGFDAAFLKALDFVGPKLSILIRHLEPIANKTDSITLYCARGGMRSQAMQWLYRQAGYQVNVIAGGYKRYRERVLNSFKSPLKLRVICGLTGTGKTKHLIKLSQQGIQILNLEDIARHRGSAFGQTLQPQPTTQQFENNLHAHLSTLDPHQTIWVEDESQMIGQCQIPKTLYEQMIKAPSTLLEMSIQDRIGNILKEYAPKSKEEVGLRIEQILKISKRLGLERTKYAITAVKNGQFGLAVSLILPYYDKTYGYGLAIRQKNRLIKN